MKYSEIADNDIPPEMAWNNIQTGVPVTFFGWRGIGAGGILSHHNRENLGRNWLLGEGIYVAPSRYMAAKYGFPVQMKIILHNPFTVRFRPSVGWIWEVKQLDLDTIRQKHDGIVIVEGKTQYREDMRQAVIFPPYAAQVQEVPKRKLL